MKYLLYIIIGLATTAFLYFGIFNSEQSNQQWETKTDNQLPVTIKVTPIELSQSANQWRFTVVFDTHSESLDQDLTKAISLADDKGSAYQPIAWEGSGPGGHHREGVLVFNAIQPMPQSVELKIKNVGGIPERLFQWDI